jgi:hypothetical protein
VNQFAQAVATLQGYAQHAESRSHFLTERYEEALNDLVRNPHRAGDAAVLVDGALANARKKLAHRGELMPRPASPTLEALDAVGGCGQTAAPALPEEPPQWAAALKPRSRRLVGLTAIGFRAVDLARLEELSTPQTWVALSRARAEARLLYASLAEAA